MSESNLQKKDTDALDPETKEQLAKVKKLITANNADSFALAVELVRTLGLDNEAIWLSLLAKSRIGQLSKLVDIRVTNLLLEIAGTGQAIWGHVMRELILYNPRRGTRYFDRPSLTSLSEGAAQALSQHKGALLLNGLTSLSDEAAQALSQHKGDLYLNGLASLSDEAAQALSQQNRDLYLNGLTSLSDAAAQALAKHKGYLAIPGLTSLSDEAVEALAQHKGGLLSSTLLINTDPTDSITFYEDGRVFRYENGYRIYL